MPETEPRVLQEQVKDGIAAKIRIRAGRFPGDQILDLGSEDGFVGLAFAEAAEDWTVYAPQAPEDAPENLETVDLGADHLPFEDGQLAGVVGAYVTQAPEGWGPELAEELARVLVEEGRIQIAFRAPGPRSEPIARTLPDDAVETLTEAGFEHAMETKELELHDGSELRLLRAVKPG